MQPGAAVGPRAVDVPTEALVERREGARGGGVRAGPALALILLSSRCEIPFISRREMPLYSYQCKACEAEFELLLRTSDTPSCPSCGSSALEQQIAKISPDIRYPRIAKSWRQAAAASCDLSNFSPAERKL